MLTEKLIYLSREVGADVVYLTTDYLRQYVTGFYSSDGFVLFNETQCTFVVDMRYAEAAQKALNGSAVEVLVGSRERAEALLKGYRTVGVPFSLISHAEYARLREQGFELIDCTAAFERATAVKSEEEIAQIQTACTIAERAFHALLPQIKEDMSEREVAAILEYEMRKRGAEGTSFDTICAFGANSSVPHHETGDTKLRFGDVILLDFGCKVHGYCSDITRTLLFGDDNRHEEFKRCYQAVYEAHMLVKERARVGMSGREIDAIARDRLAVAGIAEAFTHSLGHGIGLNIHEFPTLSPRSEQKIMEGMVFSDEPGVYFAGKFGIRIEDSVMMTANGIVSLMNESEKKLVIL